MLKQKMVATARELPRFKTKDIYRSVLSGSERSVRSQMPLKRSMLRRVREAKGKEKCRTIDAEVRSFEILDQLQLATDDQRFLVYDSRQEIGEFFVLVHASPEAQSG